ncbi:MAG: hypothetical protein ACYCPT_01440 [Acidimicrobiales bacterium]
MKTSPLNEHRDLHSPLKTWLDRPLSAWWCVLSWIVATTLFVTIVTILNGPGLGDANESLYATWSIAHESLACAYPPLGPLHVTGFVAPFALAPPLYPLLSAGLSALLRIGHSVPFPTTAQLGAHCATAVAAESRWALRSNALSETLRLGYLGWFVLLAGIISCVRVFGRGRQRWEPVVITLVAVTLPIPLSLVGIFHPQDLLAVGLGLGAVALANQGRWSGVGVLVGLAVLSQQFAILIAVALFISAPWIHRIRFAFATLVTVAIVAIPLISESSGRALRPVLLGSSRAGYIRTSSGGTVLWELHLHGLVLFCLSRIAPIVVAAGLAWWARRRLGAKVLEPVALTSLVATSLCLRLIFEVNLFPYYFIAVAVALVVLDVARGQLRGYVLAWLSLTSLAFYPLPFGIYLAGRSLPTLIFQVMPLFVIIVVVAVALRTIRRHHIPWYLLAWLVVVLLTCVPSLWGVPTMYRVVPYWLWQVLLVPLATLLAVSPLASLVRASRRPQHEGPRHSSFAIDVRDSAT